MRAEMITLRARALVGARECHACLVDTRCDDAFDLGMAVDKVQVELWVSDEQAGVDRYQVPEGGFCSLSVKDLFTVS